MEYHQKFCIKVGKKKNFFRVKVKGPTLNFEYFYICFCCKSINFNYIITHVTSTLPTPFRASSIIHFQQCCSHQVVPKSFNNFRIPLLETHKKRY